MVGGILTSAVGTLVLMFNIDDVTPDMPQYLDKPPEAPTEAPTFQAQDVGDDFFGNFNESESQGGGLEEFDDMDFIEEDEPVYEDLDTDDFDFEEVDLTPKEPEKVLSSDEALNLVENVPAGMYTRQFLFDNYCRKLGNINPSFAVSKKISEDSSSFDTLYYAVQTAGKAYGLTEENLPELISAEETLFTIKLVTTRVKGITHEKLATELVSIYRANEPNRKLKGSIFATSESVGTECRITLFTGVKPLVSLKDMYDACKDFILDSKHLIPVVIGIDESGNVLTADFKNIESILVAGMPRTGKSWLVQSMMSQMCAYCSPDELQFYIGDPKDGISDFKSFTLPHVRKFASGDDNIVKMLEQVVRVEAPRRKKILGEAGVVNIWDYKEKYPDVKLPLIYVVIDEVVTLAMRMEKDTKKVFQAYLTELISQLPALGIRAFLIPHIIKDDIISKKTTDLIQCRISVCGDEKHIEDCLSATPKQFKFKLSCTGELAVKVPEISASVLYARSSILSASNNENNDIFEYQRRLWNKIEPGCSVGSVAEDRDTENALEALQERGISEEPINFAPSPSSATSTPEENTVVDDNFEFDFDD
jgi:S-DNA-T family DNA segregation ATPase FtsK/SpoIIIE